jgi:hypothetical protein
VHKVRERRCVQGLHTFICHTNFVPVSFMYEHNELFLRNTLSECFWELGHSALDSLHQQTNFVLSVISGFRRDAEELCALLGYYAASSGNPLRTFRDNVSLPSSRIKKFKKSTLLELVDRWIWYRYVVKRLSLDAALYPNFMLVTCTQYPAATVRLSWSKDKPLSFKVFVTSLFAALSRCLRRNAK